MYSPSLSSSSHSPSSSFPSSPPHPPLQNNNNIGVINTTTTTTTTTNTNTNTNTNNNNNNNNNKNHYLYQNNENNPFYRETLSSFLLHQQIVLSQPDPLLLQHPLSPTSSVSTTVSSPPTSPILLSAEPLATTSSSLSPPLSHSASLPQPPPGGGLSNVLLKNIEIKNNPIVKHPKWSDEQLRELRVLYDRVAQRLLEEFEIELVRKEWKLYFEKKEIRLMTRPSGNVTSSNCLAFMDVQCIPQIGTAYTRDWECRYQYDKFLDDFDILYYYTCNDKDRAKKHQIPYSEWDVILLRMTTNKMVWVKSREATMIQISGPHPTRPNTHITVGCTVEFSGTPPHPSHFVAGCSMLAWMFEGGNGQGGKTSRCTHICNFDFARDSSSIGEIFVLPLFPKFPMLNSYFKLIFIRSKLKEIQAKSEKEKHSTKHLLTGLNIQLYSINRKKLADAKKRLKITINFTRSPNDWATLILERDSKTNWKSLTPASPLYSKLFTIQYNYNHTLNDRKLIFIKTSFEYDCSPDKLSLLLLENYINWDKFVHTISHGDRGVIVAGGGGAISKEVKYNVPSYQLQCLRYFGYFSDGKPFSIEERENGDICFYVIRKTNLNRSALDIYFLVYKINWIDKLESYSNLSKEKQIGKTIKSFLGGGVGGSHSYSKPATGMLSSSVSSVSSSSSQTPMLLHMDNNSREAKDYYYHSIVQLFQQMVEGIYFKLSTDFLENLKVLSLDESLKLPPLSDEIATIDINNNNYKNNNSNFFDQDDMRLDNNMAVSVSSSSTSVKQTFKRTNSSGGGDDLYDVNMNSTPNSFKRSKETHHSEAEPMITSTTANGESKKGSTNSISSSNNERKTSVCSIGALDIDNKSRPSLLDSNRPDSFLLPPFFPSNHYWKPTTKNNTFPTTQQESNFPFNIHNSTDINNNNNNNKNNTTNSSEPYILLLPQELLHFIFSFFGDVMLCRLSRTCKYFKMVSESDYLWYPTFVASFGKCCFKPNRLDKLLPPSSVSTMWDNYRKTEFPEINTFKNPLSTYFSSKETMFESIPTSWKKKFLCKVRTESLWTQCTDTQPQNNGLNYYPSNSSASADGSEQQQAIMPLSSVTICSYFIYPSLVTIYPKLRSDSISSCLIHHSKAFFATDQNIFIQANIYETVPDKMFKPLYTTSEYNPHLWNNSNSNRNGSQDDIEMDDISDKSSLKLWLNDRGILHSLSGNRRLYKIDTNNNQMKDDDDLMEDEQQKLKQEEDGQQWSYVTLNNTNIHYPAWNIVGCSNSKNGAQVAVHYNNNGNQDDNNEDHDTVVDLFNCHNGRHLKSFYRSGEEITAINLNTTRLGVGGISGPIDLHDIHLGSKVITFLGHNDKITSINVLDDEDIVVSASKDCTVKFYDERGGPYYVKRIVTSEPVRQIHASTTRLLCATKSNLSYYDPRNLSKPIGQLWNPPKTNVVSVQMTNYNVLVLFNNGISHVWDFR